MGDVTPMRCQIIDCWGVARGDCRVCPECMDEIGRYFVEKHTIFGSSYRKAKVAHNEEAIAEGKSAQANRARERSVVYYIRIGDHVKIGYTTNLLTRVGGLRADRDAVLAAEPGWREVESQRHAEFAAERQGRRENFNPSPRLLAHIAQVVATHGDPFTVASHRTPVS